MNLYAVNLSTVFTEVPFLERFKEASDSGFTIVECQFPYEASVKDIKQEVKNNGLTMALINLPAGDWVNGERGLAIFPERKKEFKSSVAKGIEYATGLGVSKIHCLAGVLPIGLDYEHARKVYIENLRFAAKEMAVYNITLLIEPINSLDMPGYFLNDVEDAVKIIEEVGMPNLRLQFDFYHIQRTRGNLIETYKKYYDWIEHIQIADVPGRHEPGTGEIQYDFLFETIHSSGYKGYIGLEYIPIGKSKESFNWVDRLKREES